MRENQKKMIIMDCKIMLKKLGDIPFDLSYEKLQTDLWNIGNKYGATGSEVFKIFMDNFNQKKEDNK